MPGVLLVDQLLAGELDLPGVDDHDVVSAVEVLGEGRFVLASEDVSDLRGQSGHVSRHSFE